MMTATRGERSTSPKRTARRDPEGIVTAVRPVAQQVGETYGLVLWDVSFGRVAGQQTLTVAVDRVGGITSGDLQSFSESLSRELDRTDAVSGDERYTLEVTSPGAERKLTGAEQFQVCVGRIAKVTLRDGRTVEGEIAGVSDRSVELKDGETSVRALFDDIAKARLVVRF